MIYGGMEGVEAAEALLKEAGFAVSQPCCSRPSCFDFVARKNDELVLIKLQSDIDNFSPKDSVELDGISQSVSAASLLVSEKTRDRPLEDDTVYSRYNVPAVTPKTFEGIIVGKTHPLVQAGPGGYYVEIDGSAIRRRRQELSLSAGEMAQMIGISRRTLYGYERGMTKASVGAAYNMVYILGIPVGRSVNVLQKPRKQRKCRLLARARRMVQRNKFLTKIFKSDRYDVTTVLKAPFDFVINVPEERMKIIGGVAGNEEQGLDKRIDEILSFSKVVQAHPVLIGERQKLLNKEIPCVYREELSRISKPQDLIANAT